MVIIKIGTFENKKETNGCKRHPEHESNILKAWFYFKIMISQTCFYFENMI